MAAGARGRQSQRRQRRAGIRRRIGAAVPAEEDVPEAEARRLRVAIRALLVEATQLVVARLLDRRQVLDQERELLRQAPPHQHVAVVEAAADRLAVEDLLAHLVFDQRFELLLVRRPAALRLPGLAQPLDLAGADGDAIRRIVVVSPAPGVEREEERAADQEVDERLAQEARAGDSSS